MWTFLPILKSTIWGGKTLAPLKNIDGDAGSIGESWEISAVEGSESIVSCGPDKGLSLPRLIEKYGERLVGKKNFKKYGTKFPLLIKFIDAAQDLSVQVHPGDELARRLGHLNGKTEMWYVVGAKRGARLALGFNRPVEHEEFNGLVASGEIEDALRYIPIASGDAFMIPSGTVHSIGKGAFLVEIQQSSDDTFRIYDYHRKDAQGRERELHLDLAGEALNFNFTDGKAQKYQPVENIPVCVASCPFFTVNVLHLDMDVIRDYRELDSFSILIATEGSATIGCGDEKIRLKKGFSVLIPASAKGVSISPDGKFSCLETYIR